MKRKRIFMTMASIPLVALTLTVFTMQKTEAMSLSSRNKKSSNENASDKKVMTIKITEEIPIADKDGQIPGSKETPKNQRKTVFFGNYYKDKSGNEKKPVEWLVLDEQDGYTLLMTKDIVDSKGWVNNGRNDITWAQTDLRQWLNNDFYNAAFSPSEQSQMALFNAVQPQNPRYKTPAGKATVDTVSILNYQELIHYMPTNLERRAKPTGYAAEQGCYLNPEGDSAWWLRSPGPTATLPEHLASWGNLGARDHYIDDYTIGVRPTVWVKSDYLESVN